MKYKQLKVNDFKALFGEDKNGFTLELIKLINKYDFCYRDLKKNERDQQILKMINKIQSPDLKISGPANKKTWIKGWGENLKEFKKYDLDINYLVPKFVRKDSAVRLFGDFVRPLDPKFELNFLEVFRMYICKKYLQEVDNVYEFGAGTGFNLIALAKIFPDKNLYGSDWVGETKSMIDLIAKKHGFNIEGFVFDFFEPDKSFKIKPNSAVLLIGALEQTGENYKKFLKYLIKQKPKIVVHVDSMNELYDENNLIDFLALWHDRKRNYLFNYLKYLNDLEKKNEIKIEKIQKVPCGGFLHEGYSFDVWSVK